MRYTTRVGLLAGAAALTLTSVSYGGPATEANNDDLVRRLAAAEAKITAMERAQGDTWLTEERAAEIRGLVQDVLADADTRASLLQAGMTSGYDNGFIIGSSDGNWLLRTNFLMQQRFIYSDTDGPIDGADMDTYGFENTRSKWMLSGHVVNPDWFFRIDMNVGSPSGAGLGGSRGGTSNAYLGYDYGNGWSIQMGSMKAPFLREELVESHYQLAVERSNTNYFFTTGYADGIALNYQGDQVGFKGMFSDGLLSGQTPWMAVPGDTDYALTGRVEYLAQGNWDQFSDFTNQRGGEQGVLIGGAIHYEEGESDTPFSTVEILLLTADVSVELDSANLFGSLMYADFEPGSVSPFGILVQGGLYFNESWEGFARLEWTDLDIPGADDPTILTLGVNKYFAGHNAKWTTDIAFGLETLPPGTVAGITGVRPNTSVDDDQFVVRTQWQLMF